MALPGPQVIQGELYVPDPRTGQLIPEWQAKLLGIPILGTVARELIGPEQFGAPVTGAAPMGFGKSVARWARPGAGTPIQQLQRSPALKPTQRVPFEQSAAKAAKESQYPIRSAAQRRALGLPEIDTRTPLQRGAEYMTSGSPRVPAGMGGQNIEMLRHAASTPMAGRVAAAGGAGGMLAGIDQMNKAKLAAEQAARERNLAYQGPQMSLPRDPGPQMSMLPAQSVMGLAQEGAKPEPSLAAQPQEVATAQEPYVVKENDTLTDIATAHLSQGAKLRPRKRCGGKLLFGQTC